MPTTSGPFAIVSPDDGAPLIPWESHFQTLGQSVATSLRDRQVLFAVNDVTERNTLLPSPIQGDRVLRRDMMVEETYYGVYNSGSNKGGAAVAGWYPSGGNVPRCALQKTTAQNTTNGTVIANWGTVIQDRWGLYSAGTPTRITVAIAGIYRVHARVIAAVPVALNLLINGSVSSSIVTNASTPSVGSNGSEGSAPLIPLSAGDYLEIRVQAASAGAITTGTPTVFEVEWVEPRAA